MMTARDVPFATASGRPKPRTSTGISRIPPPTPSTPASTPVATPAPTRRTMSETSSGPRPEPPCRWKRNAIADASMNAPKARPRTTSGRVRSSLVPIAAPATEPAARSPAAGQSTAPSSEKPATPASAIGTIAAREVACARRCAMREMRTRPGTIRMPPPTPNRPASPPASRPTMMGPAGPRDAVTRAVCPGSVGARTYNRHQCRSRRSSSPSTPFSARPSCIRTARCSSWPAPGAARRGS